MEQENIPKRKHNMKDLYRELSKRYNTMPIYITDPAIFNYQCATAMSEASGSEEFIEMVADIKESNMAEAVTYAQNMFAEQDDRFPGLTCLVSMDSILDLAGVPVYENLFQEDRPTMNELDPEWLSDIKDYLPERSECIGGRPPNYLSSEESDSEDDAQSDYSESSVDEVPVKPRKRIRRGASPSTTGSSSTSASTEGRTLRNGKRTRTPDDADTVVDEAPKNKRRRKGKTSSSNSSNSNNSSSNSSSSHSASLPSVTESAPDPDAEYDLLDDGDFPLLRRSGRLNRIAGRRSA
ncbi:uncharacterized protein NECHADRAFT_77643 [Fusarium vanettenii 77-13-4]|uniref:Uncharacterized protein n=1 Tax=Fusarium vanettenii (strain ATCC MYA-4622 / CBS 123669 / FGSC 9596 / NRRL 45880 / 77-13-4) TaxID=660122 RepID=C7YLT0_FUSV7|nr:uncharacterized protein NECHADRAFT_77643 [Fusarium vanettenii 77-13-4]EEU46828.1 predicted protein [Fusarium vanettenii 77-13-4]